MQKMTLVWQKIKKFVRKNWLICAGSFGFILLLMMFLPLFRSSWLYYPDSLRVRIALKKLVASSETARYCREDCLSKRLVYTEIISNFLKQKENNLESDLETAITHPKILAETRSLLIKIWQESGRAPSLKLKELYNNSDTDIYLRAELANAWPELSSPSFFAEVIGNFKGADSDKDREAILALLVNRSDLVILKLIWDIILNDYPDNLKAKAWFLLANIDNKKMAYQSEDLINLRAILESANYPQRLKDQAILILSDYYPFYPEPSELLLLDVVSRTKYFDNYQRTFAIDILNKNRSEKISAPSLSLVDWDKYFRN